MNTSSQSTKHVTIVFAAQFVLGILMTLVEHSRLRWFSMIAFYLCFFGAPVGYFMALRKAGLFNTSSPGAQLAAAAVSGLLLSILGWATIAIVTFMFFPPPR